MFPRLLPLALLLSVCSCVDKFLEGDVPPDASLSVSLGVTSLRLVQGEETSLEARVTLRGEYSGRVSLSVTDVPPGVTAAIEGQTVRDSVTSGTLRVRAGAGAVPGFFSMKVVGSADRLPTAVRLLPVEVLQASGFALGLSLPALSVIRGGRAPLTVSVTRSAFSGPVTLSAEGPAGISGSFATNPVTAGTSLLTVTVALAVAPGNYSLKIRGTGPGVADQEATLPLTITADPIQVLLTRDQVGMQGTQIAALGPLTQRHLPPAPCHLPPNLFILLGLCSTSCPASSVTLSNA
jgi:hypothetical protein